MTLDFMEDVQKLDFNPITWIIWGLVLPIRGISWIITTIRARRYDPEKVICPACGFRGDSGTGGKTCRVSFKRTTGIERASIQHTCFRCGCNEIFSQLFLNPDKWLIREEEQRLAAIKRAASKEVL